MAASAQGIAKVDAVSRARRDLYDEVLRGWTAQERRQLACTLERLTRDMDAYLKGRGLG